MEPNIERASFPSFWISPDVNLFDTPSNRIITRPKHKRCNSGKASPYEDQTSLLKLKSALKTITRKHSPNSSAKLKKSPYQSISFKAQKSLVPAPVLKKKKVLKTVKKKKPKIVDEKLKELCKEKCKKAPKIYQNQIFCDLYDSQGNHDRIMETFEISATKTRIEDESLIKEAKFIISSNLETEQDNTEYTSVVKPPENSFLAQSDKNIKNNHLELFAKLQNLAAERDSSEEYGSNSESYE